MLETAGAAISNAFGGVLNYEMNRNLQERQWEAQKEMQERAFQMNEQAVQNQAQNMAHGLANAGLNPALANGQGAPSVAAGSAASASSNLANVFAGLSELIQAAKAPTEIEKTAAETGLIGSQETKTKAETSKTFKEIEKIGTDAKKTLAEITNINNVNQVFENQQKFLREHSAGIFSGYISQLKATKQWQNLPPKTKETLEDLAEGKTDLDIGAIEGIQKVINMQGNISERDKQILSNTKQMIIDYKQISNPKFTDAIAKLPIREQEKLVEEIKKTKEEVLKLKEETKNTQKQRILMTKQGAKLDAEARKIATDREIQELNDINYLIEHDRWGDAARLAGVKAAENLTDIVKAAQGAKRGRGGKKNNNKPKQENDYEYKNFK